LKNTNLNNKPERKLEKKRIIKIRLFTRENRLNFWFLFKIRISTKTNRRNFWFKG